MKPDQQLRNRIRESHLGEVDARIAFPRAVAAWADSVGLRKFGNAVVWHAWDAVIWAHADGGTPEQIAARIDAIIRSYGGAPNGGGAAPDDAEPEREPWPPVDDRPEHAPQPDDAPEDPPDPDGEGPMVPMGGAP